ncbi:MAG: DUF5684 domain-containing protein [Candidatus Eremiobacteraeota bacterium]|nr:DUF5684 domain-containing protein [Candidatus Eremiobacteraeota bacterium]
MDDGGGAAGCMAMIIPLIVFAVVYAYFAYTLMVIAQKTETENAWYAWIPILNIILMVNIAGKPMWWVILFFLPIANIVAAIIIWMDIAVARNKPNWVGVLIIVPFVGILIPAYLAFAD